MVELLAAGHVNWDVTLRVDRIPGPDEEGQIHSQYRSGGGSAANVAVACAGLDVAAGLIGSVGDDEAGGHARRELEAAGIDLTGLQEIEGGDTAIKYLLVDQEGELAIVGKNGVNEAIGPEDVQPEHVQSAEHLHLTSQQPATAKRLAELAVEAGVSVSFDPGRRVPERDFEETLALADLIFVNDREAATVLDGEYPASEYADRTVIVKRGHNGAAVHTPEGSYTHPGFEVTAADTTGAGDAFAAGYLASYLDGGSVDHALEFANACGALTAMEQGARTAPTREEVESYLDEQY